MAELFKELVDIVDAGDRVTIKLDANTATVTIGPTGRGGVLIVRDGADREVIRCDGAGARLRLGTTGNGGDLRIIDGSGREVLEFSSDEAVLRIGAQGNEGDLIVRDNAGNETFHVDAGSALLRMRDPAGREVLRFDTTFALLEVGAQGNEGDIRLRDADGNNSIHLDGGSGDIILRNADVAEQFDVAEAVDAAPGTVMALAQDGRLRPTASSYERSVVGVVAGGGRFRPGIVMDHRAGGGAQRLPIAMVGKAACRVDARHGPVRVGDLLTSSPTPGCAMPAADPDRAFGAVIGKAMSPLDEGTGLVEMVISLQ